MTTIGLLGPQSWRLVLGLLVVLVLATLAAEVMYRRTRSDGLRTLS